MRPPAGALEATDAGQDDPIPHTGSRENYPGQCTFQRRENRKIQFAILASASARGRIQPDLPGEVARRAERRLGMRQGLIFGPNCRVQISLL